MLGNRSGLRAATEEHSALNVGIESAPGEVGATDERLKGASARFER